MVAICGAIYDELTLLACVHRPIDARSRAVANGRHLPPVASPMAVISHPLLRQWPPSRTRCFANGRHLAPVASPMAAISHPLTIGSYAGPARRIVAHAHGPDRRTRPARRTRGAYAGPERARPVRRTLDWPLGGEPARCTPRATLGTFHTPVIRVSHPSARKPFYARHGYNLGPSESWVRRGRASARARAGAGVCVRASVCACACARGYGCLCAREPARASVCACVCARADVRAGDRGPRGGPRPAWPGPAGPPTRPTPPADAPPPQRSPPPAAPRTCSQRDTWWSRGGHAAVTRRAHWHHVLRQVMGRPCGPATRPGVGGRVRERCR
jgi:hypothetical protein